MAAHTHIYAKPADFLHKATMWVAIAGVVILMPFAINNFSHGHYILGAGSLGIVIILAFNVWNIRRGRYSSAFILYGLVPAILFFLVLALRQQGMIGAMWCYPAVLSFYLMLPERKAWMANTALIAVTIPVAWYILDTPLVIRMAATLAAVSIFAIILIRVITEQQNKLQAQAVTDPLTGLFNRTLLHVTLDQAIQQNRRTGEPMTLVALDLDHFKSINDTLGHDAGDLVLRGVAELLHKRLRRIDKVFRLGGEEFLALLHGTDAENGRRIAAQLRSALASLRPLPGYPITASIGVATLHPGEDWSEWMKRSDENLYRAKENGRDRVVA